jgi:cytidylate kinase
MIITLGDEDISDKIRTQEIGEMASRVASFPKVREALLTQQRNFYRAPGLIAEGRDMGTVVFPDACVKIFLDASVENRASRRTQQLQEKGFDVSLDVVLSELKERDNRDINRCASPLRIPEDSLIIDSNAMSTNQVTDIAITFSEKILKKALESKY